MLPQLVERPDRRRVNAYFEYVADRLNPKQERVIASQPAAGSFPKTYVKVKSLVVASQDLVPTVVNAHPLEPKKRSVHRNFHQSHACAPDVEVAISTGFNGQEHQSHQRHQNKRKGRVPGIAKGDRERDAGGRYGPVGRCIESRAPDLAAIHLASVQMGEHTQFGRVERRLRRGTYRRTYEFSSSEFVDARELARHECENVDRHPKR